MTPVFSDGSSLASAETLERRNAQRLPFALQMMAWTDGAARREPCCVALEELSVSGLYFVSRAAYPLETQVWLRACWGRQTHYAKGIVRRTAMQCVAGQTSYGCGLEFVACPQTARFLQAAASLLTRPCRRG